MSTRTVPAPKKQIDPAQWDRLKNILDQALQESSVSARSAAVRKHCAQDAHLLREAESLLAAAESSHGESEDWLEGAADKATRTFWTEDDAAREGERLGAYVIVRQLGHGGMGTVYLAERADGEFEKQVAIKILQRGTDTDEVLRRFKIERQIVARLDHPNIARLLDAGTTADGLPYFVMEFIDGVPVTRHLREQNPAVEVRLQLFLQICRAVEVAHKAGVVHRDLKPGNILITADGEPKLLDFGIAKLLEEETTELPGGPQRFSPESASPEQVRGEPATISTDVYALGALLYEMLTGCAPHRFPAPHPSRAEIIRIVCDHDIVPPSRVVADPALRRQLAGDLDRIVFQATRKYPGLRYASVAALAEDVRRHLRGELVKARPATLAYRVQRFVARNQLLRPRTLAMAAALLAIGGLLATLFFSGGRLRPAPAAITAEQSTNALPEKSIAVLPFENLSTQPDNAFFAEGVQDAILTDLTKIADLKVINRTSVQQYRSDEPRDLQQISEELRVAYLLQGSVQRAGDHVRVSVTLTDARTNLQTWAERYDRELKDVFAIQNDIARMIATQLRATLAPREKIASQVDATRNMAAYDLYLQAKESDRAVGQNVSMLDAEVRRLNEALALDPDYVPALCLLARAHAKAHFLDYDRNPVRLDLGRSALERALALAPNSGEVLLADAVFRYWGNRDYRGALAKLQQAYDSLPNDAGVLFFMGLTERRLGKLDRSIEHILRATSLDPFNTAIQIELAVNYNGLRRYDDMRQLLDHLIAWKPDYYFRYTRVMLEVSARGELEGAQRFAADENVWKENPGEVSRLRLDLALASRDYQKAHEELSQFLNPEPHGQYFFTPVSLYEGIIESGLKNPERARAAFLRAREELERLLVAEPNDGKILIVAAEVEAWLGHDEAATRLGERAAQILPVSVDATLGPEVLERLASVYAILGRKERALDLLEKNIRLPFGVTYGSLKLDLEWDSLRDEPRFQDLLRALAPHESAR